MLPEPKPVKGPVLADKVEPVFSTQSELSSASWNQTPHNVFMLSSNEQVVAAVMQQW